MRGAPADRPDPAAEPPAAGDRRAAARDGGAAPPARDAGDWWQAAFALALSSIGGAVSLLPGGVGANEATVAGLLIVLGLPGGAAGAVALLQRLLQTGVALLFGISAYLAVRRRLDLGGLFQVTARQPARQAA
ncbi:MAG: hypothetical protein E6J41_06605 [Chloroflexi bacterium]|nr:MAG: hypothetical protein E6J41_06605 [Chloroflexota bacterium]